MEEMEMKKKELKKILKKELGDLTTGCFYMNAKQMANRTATIYVGAMYREDEKTTLAYKKTIDEIKQMNIKREQRYETIANVLKQYGYSFTRETKTHSNKWSIEGEVFIRIFFKEV